MKGTVTFFLLLCFHLLGGYDAANAAVPDGRIQFLPACVEEAGPVECADTDHGFLIPDCPDSDEENEDLIGAEDEDEDELVFRKHVAAAKCLLAFCHSFLLPHFRSHFTATLSFCKPPSHTASCKYIAQRVLRI